MLPRPIPPLGLGALPLTGLYGAGPDAPPDPSAVHAVVSAALAAGLTHLDLAESYSDGALERLVGATLAHLPADLASRAFVGTKGGLTRDPTSGAFTRDGSPDGIRRAIESSLARLRRDRLDLWTLHRVDPSVALERSVEAMARAQSDGLVGAIGLSAVTADQLARAAAVAPIAAVQNCWSLVDRGPDRDGVLAACAAHGAALVAYKPLAGGLFTGRVTDETTLARTDPSGRLASHPSAAATRLAAARAVAALATALEATPAALALAWVLARGGRPLVGTTSPDHVRAAASALDLAPRLEAATLAQLDALG